VQVDQLDRGRAAVAGAVVAGPSDAVGVVAGSFDDPRAGPVPALRVEVLRAGDVGHDRDEDAFLVLRGKAAGSAARRRTMRTVRLNAYDPAHHDVVLFGGSTDNADGSPGIALGTTWTSDGRWTEHQSARSPPARTGAAMAYDAATGQLLRDYT
jgi:hypothetical protein